MNTFQRDRRGECAIARDAQGFRGGESEDWSKALAARLEAVAHRRVESARGGVWKRQVLVDAPFDLSDQALQFIKKVHGSRLLPLA